MAPGEGLGATRGLMGLGYLAVCAAVVDDLGAGGARSIRLGRLSRIPPIIPNGSGRRPATLIP